MTQQNTTLMEASKWQIAYLNQQSLLKINVLEKRVSWIIFAIVNMCVCVCIYTGVR